MATVSSFSPSKMSYYSAIEPTVIDDELLNKTFTQQIEGDILKGNIHPDAVSKKFDPTDVSILRLDFKNILKIDNLWNFTGLVRLHLDNNILERIENIHFLVNLTWLDLSFNNITKIEGLSTLKKLTDLSLHDNKITKLENMDELGNLQVFSIGNNQLSNLEDILYLLKLPQLRVLNFNGNPCSSDPNYKNYILAHFKNLRYLDYCLVDGESVRKAREAFIDKVIAMEQTEKELIEKLEKEKVGKEQAELYCKAYLDNIDNFFEGMFADDRELKKYRILSSAELDEMKEDFRAKINVIISELKHYIAKQHALREEEWKIFSKFLQDSKSDVDHVSIERITQFLKEKKKIFSLAANNPTEMDPIIIRFKSDTQKLFNYLMGQEMQLVEQLEEVIKEFEQNYGQLCTTAMDYGRTTFTRCREIENEYHERASESVLNAFDRLIKMDLDELDEATRELLADKDLLSNMLSASHDCHLTKIDQQEEILISGISKECESILTTVQETEISRNRDRVVEIKNFCDHSLAELRQMAQV